MEAEDCQSRKSVETAVADPKVDAGPIGVQRLQVSVTETRDKVRGQVQGGAERTPSPVGPEVGDHVVAERELVDISKLGSGLEEYNSEGDGDKEDSESLDGGPA
jgi:hypothetical protein